MFCCVPDCLQRATYTCTTHRENFCTSHWWRHLADELAAAGKHGKFLVRQSEHRYGERPQIGAARRSFSRGRIDLWTLAALVVFTVGMIGALCAQRASAIDISNPGSTTIEGVSMCAGPPTSGFPLIYDGTNWCDGGTAGAQVKLLNNSGVATGIFSIPVANVFEICPDTANCSRAQVMTNLQLTQSMIWNNGNDLSNINWARTPWPCTGALSTTTYAPSIPCEYQPSVATHVRAFHLIFASGPTGCTTNPVYEVSVGGVSQAASAITEANAIQSYNVTGLAIAVAAGAKLSVQETTAGVACSGTPQVQFTFELTTD